jgi:hypothetical protein
VIRASVPTLPLLQGGYRRDSYFANRRTVFTIQSAAPLISRAGSEAECKKQLRVGTAQFP